MSEVRCFSNELPWSFSEIWFHITKIERKTEFVIFVTNTSYSTRLFNFKWHRSLQLRLMPISCITLGGVPVRPGRPCCVFGTEYSVREPHMRHWNHLSTEIQVSWIGNQRRWKRHSLSGKEEIFEFFFISLFSAKSWQNPASIDREEQNKKLPPVGIEPQPPDLHSNALPTELSQHSVASLNLHGLYKVMLYWFQKKYQSPTCEVVHETNKAHFRNLLPNRFLPSSVGRVLEWRFGGCGFNPDWGQFLFCFFPSMQAEFCQDLAENSEL